MEIKIVEMTLEPEFKASARAFFFRSSRTLLLKTEHR